MTAEPKLPICWQHENVRRAISLKAKTDDKQTHYFLACHSPMSFIQDVKSKRPISEEALFRNVSTSSQRDKQVVIYGEPGTGKSHLVHWLKLRFDYGAAHGELQNIVPVLIERRSGSLKDALTQLIEQLGEDFQRYLDPVQQALEKLSAATARQMLANELSLELGPRWSDRGREKIDKRLKHLGQACRAGGFGGWLCRDGGVIDRTIALLVQNSDLKDRENSPKFEQEDLLVKDGYRTKRTNSEEVLSLIDELDDSKALREFAANCLNDALRDSIRDMVGLSGANLRGIFDSIRSDLNRSHKQLALFIEDVSAMSELDVEIVNALEPQDRVDLCQMTAVLGMTQTGFAKLRDNQKQRIEFIYRIDGETTTSWSNDKDNLSKFIARYLNAIRLDEEQVRQIANDRRSSNSDVSTSKCTECSARKECHAAFGAVNLGDCEVGLYPFTSETAPNVLELIRRDETTSESPNQRGLLIRLLIPVMSDVASLAQSTFPNVAALPVHVSDPYYWTEFKQTYLGEYSAAEQSRVRVLAGLWIEQTHDTAEAAARLNSFLSPLGLPAFGKETKKDVASPRKELKSNVAPKPTEDKTKEGVSKILDILSAWIRGEPLKSEGYFRDLLSDLIRNSIRWEDHFQPAQFIPIVWSSITGRKFIEIEGQPSAAGPFFYFTFPRNEETRSLLESLVRFEREGTKSWDFRLGEAHKRIVFQWLRNHTPAVISVLTPQVDHEVAIRSAVQLLSLVAVIRDRDTLPRAFPALINVVFKPKWETIPKHLSKEWGSLLDILDSRHKQVLDFLLNETAVRQGRTGGVNFLRPNSVLEHSIAFNSDPVVIDLGEEYFQNSWKSRYSGLPSRSSPERQRFEGLNNAIASERSAISKTVETVRTHLRALGFSGTDLKVEVQSLCDEVMALTETSRTAKVVLPDVEFDNLVRQKTFSERKMSLSHAVARAEKISCSEDPFDVLTFDPTDLLECQSVVMSVVRRVNKLDTYVAEQEDLSRRDGDSLVLAQKMIDSLRALSELSEEDSSEDQDVETA